MRHLWFLLALCLLLGCTPSGTTPSESTYPDLQLLNGAAPGERLNLEEHAVDGKRTVFEFFSDDCGPCLQMIPVMERLAAHRPDLAFRRVDIDRPGHEGIDFDSPLAEQQGIEAVPYFKIYSEDGKLEAEGKAAKAMVRDWYAQAQLFERGQADPGTREIMERYRED